MKISQKFGEWSVLSTPKSYNDKVECRCSCGTVKKFSPYYLLNNKSKSCGCINKVDLIGKKFGKLTVIKYSHTDTRGNQDYKRTDKVWLCKCECGNDKYRTTSSLNKNASCGCYLKRKIEYGLSSKKTVYNIYKKLSAGKRGIEFDIPFDMFIKLTSSNCHYCDSEPQNVCKNPRGNGDYTYNGLDRINNSKSYNVNNVVPCCLMCNGAKSNKSISEFYQWIKQLCKTQKERNFDGY